MEYLCKDRVLFLSLVTQRKAKAQTRYVVCAGMLFPTPVSTGSGTEGLSQFQNGIPLKRMQRYKKGAAVTLLLCD